jgi:toxin CcdB
MAQFQIFHNPNVQTKKAYPFLLDIQNPLLVSLETRLVVPLSSLPNIKDKRIKELNPVIDINNKQFVIITQQMASIHKKDIGDFVCDASFLRQEIISAIDFMITGF